MSVEQNKTIVRRIFEELINQENKAVIDEAFDADVIIHDPFTGTTRGMNAFGQLLGMFDAAFPGHRVTIEEMVAEGEYVSVLHTHTATHTGPFMGLPGTGKTAVVNGIELFRLRNGRIVEFWRKDDDVSLLMQLGLLPAPTAA
ncbi:MAG: ester cyclase [Anaerolineaceae bacterium]|nr:ester cyclase [Anaerolineaceae bacterium]